MKVERPRKGASCTVCDTVEGPIVRLKDGSVLKLNTEEEAKRVNSEVDEILYLGDILFNYGDFSESGHTLVPVGYVPEWWIQELEKALNLLYVPEAERDYVKASELSGLSVERLKELLNNYLRIFPSLEEAFSLSEKLAIPVHPEYTFYWKSISGKDLVTIRKYLSEGKIKLDEKGILKIIISHFEPWQKEYKKTFEKIGMPHLIVTKESLVIERKEAQILARCLNFKSQTELEQIFDEEKTKTLMEMSGLEAINFISGLIIRDKSGTFIGARMGRPEKGKTRALTGSPQVMFPVGEEGDRLRSFQAAMDDGKITSDFPLLFCPQCQISSIYPRCEECGSKCVQRYYCKVCGDIDKEVCRHGPAHPYKVQEVDIKYYFDKAMKRIGDPISPDLVKGVRGTSNKDHTVEHLIKGILRAKHDVYVNKDGTTRYDCTELPLTAFKPKEIHTSIEKLKKMGYTHDIYGKELIDDNQILELKPQDVVLPGHNSVDESAPRIMFKVANFVDELLVKFYGLKPFYNLTCEEDLVGHLIIGLAPHISAGLIGRVVGFSDNQAVMAHPMWHAGLRRDCDGDEACLLLLMDALLNFSRKYLPNSRGSVMDACIVLTTILDPKEVDEQVLDLDMVWRYPLELYEAGLVLKKPGEVRFGPKQEKVTQLVDLIGSVSQYENFGFTHDTENFNKGVLCSAYKTLPTMEDKLMGQMELARKIRAVNMDDVAKLVIQKHFLKDIKGNLKKFSMQQFRCVKCNEKYRRPPLAGKCICGGKLIFTISEGSVVKYLGPSLLLAQKYDFSPYLKQTLDLLKMNVDNIFGKEKDVQQGLADYFK
jgi:DNA polymerase II large subunit